MRVETERMYLYPLSDEEMRLVIEKESDSEMKQAYTEMLEGSLSNPDKRIWYAIWNMELKNDPETIAGDFCFKGLGDEGVIEIGYGLKEEYRHHGYMTEAVKAITEWALSQDGVKQVEAETDAENIASQKVLFRSGFVSNGKVGEEGPRFVYGGKKGMKKNCKRWTAWRLAWTGIFQKYAGIFMAGILSVRFVYYGKNSCFAEKNGRL